MLVRNEPYTTGVPGWRAERMTQVFDLSDPANPVHIRDFGLVGQELLVAAVGNWNAQ